MKRIFYAINLQLFAELNTNVTTAATEGNNLSAEMRTFYDMTLIDMAGPELVHDQFGQKRPIPQGNGKTVNFRKFSSLPKATTALTEGVTPDGGKLNVTSIESTVSQYGYYIVQSDVLELTALDNTILEATKLLGKQAGLTLDGVVRDVLVAGTNVSYAPSVVDGVATEVTSRSGLTGNCKLTVDVIERAVAKLRAVNAPTINGEYVCIIHPYVAYDLRRDPDWLDAHKYAAPENLYNGEIGKIAGVRFVTSSEAKIIKNGDNYIFCCLLIADGAYGTTEITGGGLQTIVKQKGSAGTADPLDQRSSVGWKAMKTAEILVPEYLVRIECNSAITPSAAN